MTTDTKAPGGASLVINRAKWLRGEGDESMLRRPSDGKMCCLGFFGLALGVPPDDIDYMASPSDVPSSRECWPSWLLQYVDERGYYRDTDECTSLIRANDVQEHPDREAQIASIFARHGVTVTFIDDEASGNAAQPPSVTEGSP